METIIDQLTERIEPAHAITQMDLVAYGNTGTYAYYDGKNYYNNFGQLLRDPDEYNQWSEGYTPFGDE